MHGQKERRARGVPGTCVEGRKLVPTAQKIQSKLVLIGLDTDNLLEVTLLSKKRARPCRPKFGRKKDTSHLFTRRAMESTFPPVNRTGRCVIE